MDMLIVNGKSYVAYSDYKVLKSELIKVRKTAEAFLEKLTNAEVSQRNIIEI